MTALRYVVFGQPIPVADTHRREPRFEAEDGWTITRDDATELWRIEGHGVDFVTDGINSWAPEAKREPTPIEKAAIETIRQLETEQHPVFDMLPKEHEPIVPKVPRRKR